MIAYLVDFALSLPISLGALAFRVWLRQGDPPRYALRHGLAIFLICFVTHGIFLLFEETLWKTTLGKIALGLRLYGCRQDLALRSALFTCSWVILGPVWALFHPQFLHWGDRLTRIHPENRARLGVD